MKSFLAILILTAASLTAHGKPMTGSVSSWEGEFSLSPEPIPIRVDGKPALTLWLYALKSGSAGSAIGFSNEDGDMILVPHPNEKGVQPVYQSHAVTFTANGNAEIVVLYAIQGNGGQVRAEKYEYDGKTLRLVSKYRHGGRHDPVWHKED